MAIIASAPVSTLPWQPTPWSGAWHLHLPAAARATPPIRSAWLVWARPSAAIRRSSSQGGHTITGAEQAPLDLIATPAAIRKHAPHADAFAVSGYFGVLNPAHELRVRELVRQLTGLPVTCGHELTSNLHAPAAPMTAALNARLIPYIEQLIASVRQILAEKHIRAPLMVVKGDGSLMDARVAVERPVETILSGPAASVVGARYLCGEADVLVVDMGGTTTDIACLQEGRPASSLEGATVGGWRTMVEAIAVHTSGLGGDSEVTFDVDAGMLVGPQRVVPLSLLAHQYPHVLPILEQHAGPRVALRIRRAVRYAPAPAGCTSGSGSRG